MCEVCGRSFRRFASQVRLRGPARFCSRACQVVGTRKYATRPCLICERPFYPPNGHDSERGRYCSRRCWDSRPSARLQRECAYCGMPFVIFPSVTKDSAGLYCSRPCADLARRRGERLPRRGAAWRLLAGAVRERDEYLCIRCGQPETAAGKSLSVDHIVPARMFLTSPAVADDMANLASLCCACHAIKTHRVEPRLYRGDFLAIDEFYGREIRLAAVARLNAEPTARVRLD